MTVSSSFTELLKDALRPLGEIRVRRMFSGGGVYCDSLMFGLVMDDVLYLKTDTASQIPYEEEGCGPFVYAGKGREVATSYRRMPERLYDDHEEMIEWARAALAVARRAAASKGAKKNRTPPIKAAPKSATKPRRAPRRSV